MKNYFTIEELCKSNTAEKNNIDNTADEQSIINMKKLITVLNIIREEWGKPIIVNSGYRCEELNKLVKGSKTSHHMFGKAVDITVGKDNEKLFNLIIQLKNENKIKFTQLINENNFSWIHISVDENNLKNQILSL